MADYIEKEAMRKALREQERLRGLKGLGWVEAAMDKLPTLIPPNEPLTWNEFAEMEGQPVYIVETGAWRYWALVTRVGKDSADFMTVHDPDNYGDKELYGESWVAYRRPPEGKEGRSEKDLGRSSVVYR